MGTQLAPRSKKLHVLHFSSELLCNSCKLFILHKVQELHVPHSVSNTGTSWTHHQPEEFCEAQSVMVPRGPSTFTCPCHRHPERRVHPQGPARQPLSHQVIIQSLTATSKCKEHLRKKLPQGQCLVAFYWWGVIPGAQDSWIVAVPISPSKTEEVDVEHKLLKTLLPPLRLSLATTHQKHLLINPAWLIHRMRIRFTSALLPSSTSREHRLWASFSCTTGGMLKWELGKWAWRRQRNNPRSEVWDKGFQALPIQLNNAVVRAQHPDILIYIIFNFIRLSVGLFFFSWQRCICKRISITTKLEKAASPCFTLTCMKDIKHMAAANSC